MQLLTLPILPTKKLCANLTEKACNTAQSCVYFMRDYNNQCRSYFAHSRPQSICTRVW